MASCETPTTSSAAPRGGVKSSIFFMARKAFRKCIPFTAVLELTYRCNFRCTMCYVIHENTEGELSTQEWFNVLDQLSEAGTLYLEITGGEIFIRRDIWEILAYAEKKRFLMNLFTNASYINAERAERLRKFRNIVGYSISLYGGDAETFDQVTHVKGSHDRVLKALQILRDTGARVKTKSPITTENVGTVNGMREMAKSAACTQFVCAPLISPRDDRSTDPTRDRISDEDMRALFRAEDLSSYEAKKVNWSSPTCSAGRSLVGISPQGDVYPCIQLRKSSGNLREKHFKELWDSQVFDEVRSFSFSKMEKCQSCTVVNFCSPCIGLNELENGDMYKPSSETCRLATLGAEAFREKKRLPMAAGGRTELAHCAIG